MTQGVSPLKLRIDADTNFPNKWISKNQRINFEAISAGFGVSKDDSDEPKPLKIDLKVSFELDTCSSSKSLLGCPMIAPRLQEEQVLHKSIDFRTGCAIKDGCQCNLQSSKLKAEINAEIVVGKQSQLTLKFNIINSGSEPAYGTVLKFTTNIDNFIEIRGPRGNCITVRIKAHYYLKNVR